MDFALDAFLAGWLAASVRLAGPLLLAALGEIFAQRSGVLNIGIEGTMLLGALAAYLVTWQTGGLWFGIAAALCAGLLAGVFLAFMYVTVRASQVVVGIIFNILALGIASYGYRLALGGVSGVQTTPMFAEVPVPYLADLPILGDMLFNHSVPLYLTAMLAALAWFMLHRTAFGLNLRSVGENPRAADTAGIDVGAYRYAAVLISSAGAALAGAYLVLALVGQFRETIVAGQGFMALAIVIFGRWDPARATVAAIVFGAADSLQLTLQMYDVGVPPQLLLSLPYVLTIIAMSGIVMRADEPEALQQPYLRE